MSWFEGSKEGLEKIARRRGLTYVLFELMSNCWDTDATQVTMTFEPLPNRPVVRVRIEDDDPDGFADLSHSYTLFAESIRKGDVVKRGRFCAGDKLVLAVCDRAEINSTKGSVIFDADGRRSSKKRRDRGSVFEGDVKMTREELSEVLTAAKLLLPPVGVETRVDGVLLQPRPLLKSFEATLPTEVADAEGYLKPTARKTTVNIYEPLPGEPGRIYEMGIPVCETGDHFDVDIQQKIPISMERNSVTASFLKTVRVHVLNETFGLLKHVHAATPAVQEAISDKRVSTEAITKVLDLQYGKNRAIFDPSDVEAGQDLVSKGYNLIPGGAFSRDTWLNIKEHGAAVPAGKLNPTPKPYSSDPDAASRKLIPEEKWSPGMKNIANYTRSLASKLIQKNIAVVFDQGRIQDNFLACYGDGELTFNISKLGYAFFDNGPNAAVNSLLLHELAHDFERSHLSQKFSDAIEKMAAQMIDLALDHSEFFHEYGRR